jgi:hypothetical protein
MALQPLDRPASSTVSLRFRGNITVGNTPAATYPKPAAEIPSNSTISGSTFLAYVRFPLFDATDPTDMQKRLPAFVFDDGEPAGESPHDPVACVASSTPGVNVADLSLNRTTWAQNLEVTLSGPISGKHVLVDAGVSVDNDPANGVMVVVDTLTSGLGLNTGLPVVIVAFQVDADEGALQSFPVDVTIEVRHSARR